MTGPFHPPAVAEATVDDIGDAARIRIAAMFVEACDLAERVSLLCHDFAEWAAYFRVLADRIDDRPTELGEAAGMDAVWEAVKVIRTYSAAALLYEYPAVRLDQLAALWPDTAWLLEADQ